MCVFWWILLESHESPEGVGRGKEEGDEEWKKEERKRRKTKRGGGGRGGGEGEVGRGLNKIIKSLRNIRRLIPR